MSMPLRVLILEDRATDAELMLHELRWAGYALDSQRVQTELDYLAYLEPTLDVILADYTLPQFDALRALHLLQERNLDIPFIVVTGIISEEAAVECMKQGAADYLLKDRLGRLGHAVEHALREKRIREDKRRAEEALRESEAHYRRLFEDAALGIFQSTLEGKAITVNPAFAHMFGYDSPEDVITTVKNVGTDLFADPQRWSEIVRLMVERPDLRTFENLYRRKDGSTFTGNLHVWMVRDRDNHLLHVEGFIEDITERKQAEEALSRRAAQLALINDIGRRIAAALDLDEVLNRAAGLMQASFGYHHVALFAVDREQDELVMRARAGNFAHLFPPDHRIKLDRGVVGWVGRNGERLLANDVRTEPHYVNFFPDVILTQSELSVPIRVSQETIGVLDVQSPQVNAFDENDVTVMETLADQIAVAIENARLYETIRRELAERERAEKEIDRLNQDLERWARGLAALNQAGQIMTSTLDLNTLLERVMDQVRSLLDVEGASVLLCTSPAEADGPEEAGCSELVFAAVTGPGAKELVGKRLPSTTGIASWVIRDGLPALIADAPSDPRFYSSMDAYSGITTRSLLAVPLVLKGSVLGVVEAVNKAQGTFDQRDLEVLEALCRFAAIAVDNAQLYKSAVDAAERRTILHWLSQEIFGASLDSERIYTAIHQAVSKLMPAEAFTIALLDEARQEIDPVYCVDRGGRQSVQRFPRYHGLSGHVIISGKSVHIGDLGQGSSGLLDVIHFGDPIHVRSILAVPMRLGSRVLGVLSAQSYKPHAYTAEDLNLLEILAAYAATALENARHYASEQQRAATLARALEQQRELDRLQHEFIQNVSHELRTPLALIRGHAEVLENGWLGERRLPRSAPRPGQPNGQRTQVHPSRWPCDCPSVLQRTGRAAGGSRYRHRHSE